MITINAYDDGCSTTIKANYYKTSLANFIRGGQRFAAPGIIECDQEGNLKQCDIEELLKGDERFNQG